MYNSNNIVNDITVPPDCPAPRSAPKVIGIDFIMQQNNDPKRTANTTQDFIREKKSPDLNPIEYVSPPEEEIERKKTQKTTTERGCSKSLKKTSQKNKFVDVNGFTGLIRLLQARDMPTKYEVLFTFIYCIVIVNTGGIQGK